MKIIATYARKLKDASGNYIAPATRASCVYMEDDTTLEDFVNNLDLKVTGIYPVGSIYQSTDSTSPASLFGGSWEKIQNMFLLGSGSRGVGTTGGEENHVLTVNEMPSHKHNQQGFWNLTAPPSGDTNRKAMSAYIMGTDAVMESSLLNTGGNWAHNNMPPFYTVNIWRRTA